jgi:radical SAM protein with 4Fe4S-binding SPASM domain
LTTQTNSNQNQMLVDLRQIAPRDRHPLIFQTFDGLAQGDAFVLVNDHEPRHLYYHIAHTGQVFPSGFLPISGGNVRKTALADIYQTSDLFCALRDADQLEGKCGRCAYRTLCGGSRARAYAATGNPLASDPLCPYQPRAEGGTTDALRGTMPVVAQVPSAEAER